MSVLYHVGSVGLIMPFIFCVWILISCMKMFHRCVSLYGLIPALSSRMDLILLDVAQ